MSDDAEKQDKDIDSVDMEMCPGRFFLSSC